MASRTGTSAMQTRARAPRPAVHVAVVSDHRLLRDGICMMLEQRAPEAVVVRAVTVPEALAHWRKWHKTSVMVVDIATNQSAALVRAVTSSQPAARIVAVGVVEDLDDNVVILCAEAGVLGYVSCDASLDDLIVAIRRAEDGETACSSRVAGMLVRNVAARARDSRLTDRDILTPREREVADLVRDCLSNKEIAAQLGVEVATVKNHVHQVLRKLRLTRRAEIVARRGAPVEVEHHAGWRRGDS